MVIKKDSPSSVEKVVEVLSAGKVAILPTDTIYGFSGLIDLTKEAILNLKDRPKEKKMIRLIGNPEDIVNFTNQIIPKHILKFWPGALTLIVKSKNEKDTLAVRCPGDDWLRDIINKLGYAIYSTSVNKAGHPAMTDIKKIIYTFEKQIGLIVDNGNMKGFSSTIIDLTNDDPIVLRRGSVVI